MTKQRISKKQHYIPQFYLRQWIDLSGGFYPIRVDGKIPPGLFVFETKSSPSRFCYENFFYAQYTGKKDNVSQFLEKSFADIEGVFSAEISRIEEKIINNEHITEEEKYHLSEFMIFLWIKGKKWREQSQKLTEDMTKQINRFLVRDIDRIPKIKSDMEEKGLTKQDMINFAEKGEYSVEFGNMYHLALLKDMYGFCNLLSAKYWRVYISRRGEFIATDAPYLDRAVQRESFWGNDFLSREQSFILSPRVVVVALCPKKDSAKKFVRKDITGDRDAIQAINCHNLMNSIKFGFHEDRTLLKELENMVVTTYKSVVSMKDSQRLYRNDFK